MSLIDKFLDRVSSEPNTGCWLWSGSVSKNGYGVLTIGSRSDATRRRVYAHRIAYLLYKGEIPKGLEPDHKCRVRSCVNPDHLEAVTRSVNTKRGLAPTLLAAINGSKTHCKNGHAFTPDNTYLRPTGGRSCRECLRLRACGGKPRSRFSEKCTNGHPYTEASTYTNGKGHRSCRTCIRERYAR